MRQEEIEAESTELREILAQIGDPVVGCDFEETITYFSAAAEQFYGVPRADAVGRKLKDIFEYQWLCPGDEAAAYSALKENGEWHGQNFHITRDGRRLQVDSRVRILKDAHGQPNGFLAVIRDITFIKQNEAKLQEHDQRLRHHVDNSPLAVVEWDRDFNVTRWAGQAEAMFGWSSHEVVGRPLAELDIVYEEDIKTVQRISRALSSGTTRHLTSANRNVTKHGRVIHCIWHNSVLLDAAGQVQSILSFVQDITAQKNAEQALKASEQVYRLVTESSQTGFWDWDLTKGDIRFSEIYKKQLGYEDHELSSSLDTFRALCHPGDFERVTAELKASQADPSIPFNTELQMRHKDGSWRWIWCQAMVIRDHELKPVRMIGTHIDLSERKKIEQQIHELNAQLEHRVRQRTQELRDAVQTLEKEIVARRRLEQEVLETSEREQSRLGQDLHDDLGQQLAGIGMLAQLLGAKLQAQNHPTAADAAELSSICRNALDTTRNLARSFYPVELQKHGLQIAIEALAHRTEAMTEAVCKTKFSTRFKPKKEAAIHLYRIVQESITNAIRHGRARNISIEGTQQAGMLVLTITDDGIGLKNAEASSGLGLHIFQYRARLIGAKVEVNQLTPSGGCRVTCLLPIAKASVSEPRRQ